MNNFKQAVYVLLGAFVFTLWVWKEGACYHNFFFRSADDITSGILNNDRLDSSSVTKRGPLTDGLQVLVVGSITATGQITSTAGFIGPMNSGGAASTFDVVTVDSMTSIGTITSTSAFIGGASTFTAVHVRSGLTSVAGTNLRGVTITSNTSISGDVTISSPITIDGRAVVTASATLGTYVAALVRDAQVTIQRDNDFGIYDALDIWNTGSPAETDFPSIRMRLGIGTAERAAITADVPVFSQVTGMLSFWVSTGSWLKEMVRITSGSFLVLDSTLAVNNGVTRYRNVTYTWPSADGSSGRVLATNGSGGLSWATDASGSGSNPFSTGTKRMSMTGVIGVASTTFVGLPGWWFSTGPDTFTITEIYASVANPSNIAATLFRVAWSTGGSFPGYSYVSPEVNVPISASAGVGISTTFVGLPNTLFSVHVTSVASTGAPASNASFIFKGWGWNRP